VECVPITAQYSVTCYQKYVITVYFRLIVRKRNIEFQIDKSYSAKLSSWLNAIGQFIFQYCVMWTTNLKFTVTERFNMEGVNLKVSERNWARSIL